MKRFYQDYSNLELADIIESRSIVDDGIPDHIREALLRFLWRDQAFIPAERLPVTNGNGKDAA
jgi:hypothetical protein